MVEVFENIVTPDQISELLKYMSTDDRTTDARPDVQSKDPKWDVDQFPQKIVKNILDQVLTDAYWPEAVLFYDSRISFRVHVDSADGNQKTLYKNVLIPLWNEGYAATVLFDNYWLGPSTRFSQIDSSPFRYNLPDKTGKFIWAEDIRDLLDQCKNNPELVTEFTVNDQLISDLENLIKLRSGSGPGFADRRTSDYSQIINYKPEQLFDPKIHAQYINHVPIENLHGLTVDRVVEWMPGSVIVFDRNQIHCAASGHTRKIGISVFSNRK